MRVGFSGTIFSAKLSGNGYYLYWLLKSLLEFEDENEYVLFSPGDVMLPEGLHTGPKLKVMAPPFSLNRKGLRTAFDISYVPYKFGRMRLDVLHMPTDGGGYWAPGGKLVVSLMGIAARHFPDIHPKHIRVSQRWRMALSARAADLVLTISQSSKRDLVEMFAIPPDKVKVIYLGVDPIFSPQPRKSEQAVEVRAKYDLPEQYILYVGNLEPRKNIQSLVRAFGSLQSHHDLELVIVGRKAWLYNDIFETAAKSGFADRIHFTGYVDLLDLPWIYSLAEVFVFPSLFEGFGIPNLEAMACGTPVISSNTSSIPEVVGDAGILVDPLNVEQIADAIQRVCSDSDFSARLSAAGIERAKRFTWQRTARETLDAYSSLFVKNAGE